MALRLYGRRHCHLCEEMAQALRSRGIAFDEVDVDGSPELKERYGKWVPVLTQSDGEVICNFRLDESALRKVIHQ